MEGKKKTSKFSAAFTKFSEFGGLLAGAIILISGFIIVYGVILRYFFQLPTTWEIELASYLLIAATFIAAPSALHHNAHVSVDILTENVSTKWRSILYVITGVLGILFALALAERGYQIWIEAYSNEWRSGSVWNPKLIYPYAIIPLGMLWFALQYFIEINKRIRSLAKKECTAKEVNKSDGEDLR